ncbi:MAG: sugar ABC transporter permease [Treponema sp.]|jgi:multiple sugar transport system permease protein|nr:sugar ABC transporter permease [Treponema sp.]
MKKNSLFIGTMLLPALAFIVVFVLFPAAYAFYLSLHRSAFLQIKYFAGLQHYLNILSDWRFWVDMGNSFVFTIGSVCFSFVCGLLFAGILNQQFPLRTGFRVSLILPWVMNQVAFTMLVKWLMNSDFGLINVMLRNIGLPGIDFFSKKSGSMISLILTNSWRMAGYAMVFFIAALQTLPKDMLEAAHVDGAGKQKILLYITLPYLSPQFLVILVLLTLQNFNILTPVMVLTGGGPGTATETLGLRMYREAFIEYALDRSAAYSIVILVINVILTAFYIRVIKEENR